MSYFNHVNIILKISYSQTSNIKLKCEVKVTQLCPTLYSPRNSLGQNTGVGSLSLTPEDLSNPGIEHKSPTLRADSLPAELQEKPKNTGVGSLSLFQQIFPTQELNWCLLHCRGILYQLSYQRLPLWLSW